MGKESEIQISEAHGTPVSHNQNKPIPTHIIIEMAEIQHKSRILKTIREKEQITYKEKPVRITAHFSTQNLKARGAWSEESQFLIEDNFQPRCTLQNYLSKLMENKILP